jgi:hypothetical protein
MSPSIERRRLLLASAALGALPARAVAQAGGGERLEIAANETATIDGRAWDKPIAGGTTFDAVHRSVLLRFPTAGKEIAAFLRQGRVLAGAELVLRYGGYEIVPEGYTCRDGLGRKAWTDNPPTWHVQAWPLRQSWAADAHTGPTFNASVNGARYWARFGASDPTHDRVADLLDPQELSIEAPEARIDITKLLATPAVEQEGGERLLWLERCGFLLRKVETYDTRYRDATAYEWNMPTGGHGLRFISPRLVLAGRRLASGGTVSVVLPVKLDEGGSGRTKDQSKPTAILPVQQQIVAAARAAMEVRGAARADWQKARIAQLRRVGGDSVSEWSEVEGDKGYGAYRERVKALLARPPRYWEGWGIEDLLLVSLVFGELLPAYAQEHLKNYWTAWLQPDLPTDAFVHPQSPDAIDYWKRNRDWRGRASFFRDGYNFAVSTQNFNHTAAMGALLGGALIGSQYAMDDGRHGLENLALRFWGFLDGGTQELLDHYYLSITLSAQKMFADFAPEPLDRLMGRILVDRTMELLTTLYHSQTRRFVSSSGRARLSGVLVEQDGIYGALHTLSKGGTVNYPDRKADAHASGMPVWGYDFPPGRVAVQSLRSPWGPSWLSGLIDDKPVPFEETATETTRGNFKPPLWRRSWQGRWHGLASMDIKGGTVDLLGQWVRAPKKATRLEDLGTLTVRYCANKADLATTREGLYAAAGLTLTYQSRNRAIVVAKPHNNRDRLLASIGKAGISSLATVIGLWNFSPKADWQLFAGDRRIDAFPHRMTFAERLLIKDGVTYLAILPLPTADLGRDVEIEIGPGGAGKGDFFSAEVAPALIVSMFNMKREAPIAPDDLDLARIMTGTYGGFVLEMGDAEQYGSFEAFVGHIRNNRLTATWQEKERRLDVAYRSGEDLMEAGFGTDFSQPSQTHFVLDPGSQESAIPYRKLNGEWPYLAPGIDRDTTWSQQGISGRLEKNGASLTSEPGRKAYLLADPLSGAVVGYNPLPDPQTWSLSTREGVTISADGKLGLLKVEVRPWTGEIDIWHVAKADQAGADMAKHFIIEGLAGPPIVRLNDKPAEALHHGNKGFRVALAPP